MPAAPAKPAQKPAAKPDATAQPGTTDKPTKPKEATAVSLEGVNALLSREFPSVKFEPPKPSDDPNAAANADDDDGDKADDGTAAKPDAAPAKPAAAKPKKPAAKPAQAATAPALTADQIAEAAARGTAKAMTESKQADKPAAPPTPEEKLSPAEKRKVEVLRHLEQMQPEKYKGVTDKFIKSTAALSEYASNWEREHPGQAFDDQDPEHEAFFKANDVDWEEEDYTDAAVDIRVQRSLKDKDSATSQEVAEIKRKMQLQESAATIGEKQNLSAVELWNLFGDDYKDIVTPTGQVNSVKINDLQKADPEGMQIRVNAARALDAEVAEVHKLYNGLVTFQPGTNPVHRSIQAFGAEMEDRMLKQPPEQRVDDKGRQFVTGSQYTKMSPEQQQQYWTFTADDLIQWRTKRLAKLAMQTITAAEESHRKWAKARGIELPDTASVRVAPAAAAALPADEDDDVPPPPIRTQKPVSPSSGSDTRASATRAGNGAGAGRGTVVSRLL
jgi:hypothetical protein